MGSSGALLGYSISGLSHYSMGGGRRPSCVPSSSLDVFLSSLGALERRSRTLFGLSGALWAYVLLCIMYGYVLLCTVMYCYVHLCTLMYTYVHLGTLVNPCAWNNCEITGEFKNSFVFAGSLSIACLYSLVRQQKKHPDGSLLLWHQASCWGVLLLASPGLPWAVSRALLWVV